MSKDELLNVYSCIALCSAEIAEKGIAKDKKNTMQGYNFRGIDDVYNALAPVLSKYKLVILPRVLSRSQVERVSAKGGAVFYTTVEVEYDFVSAHDQSKHTVKTYGEAMDSGDKSTNKAMSAAYKYACMQAFCIPTEGDNDADAVSHEIVPKQADKKADTPKPKAEVKQLSGDEFLMIQNGLKNAKDADELKSEWLKFNYAKPRMTPKQVETLTKAKDNRKIELENKEMDGSHE